MRQKSFWNPLHKLTHVWFEFVSSQINMKFDDVAKKCWITFSSVKMPQILKSPSKKFEALFEKFFEHLSKFLYITVYTPGQILAASQILKWFWGIESEKKMADIESGTAVTKGGDATIAEIPPSYDELHR